MNRNVFVKTLCLILLTALCLSHPAVTRGTLAAEGASSPALQQTGRWDRGPVYASAVSGDHVFFGSGGAIRVLKTEGTKSKWTKIASIRPAGIVRDLFVSGHHLYVADDSGALIIIDITNPKTLTEVGRVKLREYVRAVVVQGHYAYLAAQWAGMIIVDISNPARPKISSSHKTGGIVQDVHVSDSLALVASAYRANGLKLIDISNPLQPREIGHYDMPGIAYGVFATGGHAYVVNLEQDEADEAGLTIVDISDPTTPVKTGFHKVIYGAERIRVENSTAYLAGVANDAGLIVVDVSDPAKPKGLGGYHSPTCSEAITISGSHAYLAHGDQGLEIIDISRPVKTPVVSHHDAAAKNARHPRDRQLCLRRQRVYRSSHPRYIRSCENT